MGNRFVEHISMYVKNRFAVVIEASVNQDDSKEKSCQKDIPSFSWVEPQSQVIDVWYRLVMKLNSFRCFDWSSSLYS